MSIIKRSNNIKSNKIGSIKDYRERYNYLNERDKQRYEYQRENTERLIERVKNDRVLNGEKLKAQIETYKDRNKTSLVKSMTNTHNITVILFSIISGILSSVGVAYMVGGLTLGGISIILLTIIMLIANNVAIQPILINSLYFNKSINKYIGVILLGISTLGVFTVSVITNNVTLRMLHLNNILSYAFTFVFDVSVVGINFLHYQTCLFDVNNKVKEDLGLATEPLPEVKNEQIKPTTLVPNKVLGFTGTGKSNNTPTGEIIKNYLNTLQPGEPVNLKDVDVNYSTGIKFLNANEFDLPIVRDNSNSKNKYIRG